MNHYENIKIALTTIHQKEKVIAPAFQNRLKARIITINVDTDTLGTFSGEIERVDSPKITVSKKALLGIQVSNIKRGIATEGSFHPHPTIPLISIHHEIICFLDLEIGIEIYEQKIFGFPVYGSIEVEDITQAEEFLIKNRIGSYKFIAQASKINNAQIFKNLSTIEEVNKAILEIQNTSGEKLIRITTDMRAHCNPLRMWRIRYLARTMAKRLTVHCPKCKAPGFGITSQELGLRCNECNSETTQIKSTIFSCSKCKHIEKKQREDGRKKAYPSECNYCNP
jgi:predicted Zn-ribbon and HTH transcriptional regulator